jgi:hypothetical protein
VIEENVFFKLLTHLVGLEPMTSPSTLLSQGEEVPFELELIGDRRKRIYSAPHMTHCFLLIKRN